MSLLLKHRAAAVAAAIALLTSGAWAQPAPGDLVSEPPSRAEPSPPDASPSPLRERDDERPPTTREDPPVNTEAPAERSACTPVRPEALRIDESCEADSLPATDEVPDVASLKTPESPAFVALGMTPTEIQRPATPGGLATSISEGLVANGSTALLRNFAVEFTPYWLLRHPKLSFDDLVAQPEWAWWRRLSVSFATSSKTVETPNANGENTELTLGRAALGLQTTLWPGSPTAGARACRTYLERHAAAAVLALSNEREAFERRWRAANPPPPGKLGAPAPPKEADYLVTLHPTTGEPLPEPTLDDDQYVQAISAWKKERSRWANSSPSWSQFQAWDSRRRAAVNTFVAQHSERNPLTDSRATACLSDVMARSGFMAAVAGAHVLEIPNADLKQLDEGGNTQWHGWLTLGYVIEDIGLVAGVPTEASLLVALRGIAINGSPADADDQRTALDAGARVALGLERFGIALEGTWRDQERQVSGQTFDDTLYRVGFSVEYRVASGMWLTGSFGKDFGDTEDETPIFALANMQWNFGLERSMKTDTTVSR